MFTKKSWLNLESQTDQISFETSKSGSLTARIGKIRIHSLYDPAREAAKFLERQLENIPNHGTVIIIGAALGYIDIHLAKKRPNLKIIACHLMDDLFDRRLQQEPHIRLWSPATSKSIESFLFESIDELDLPGLQIIEWNPCIQVAPETAKAISQAISIVMQRYSGNITTTAAFGRLWLRNTLRNYLEADCIGIFESHQGATVIAASGPSLEYQMKGLKKYRSKFALWALPSAVLPLAQIGLKPDLILSTDPGHWARLHGRYFPPDIPLAMPLNAAPASKHHPVILAHNSLGEQELLGSQWPTLNVPEAGSVVISAIYAWAQLISGPLFLAGLDLCWTDMQSHSRPHSFDGWFADFENRTYPALTSRWHSAQQIAPHKTGRFRSGPSMEIYAGWFKTLHFKHPIYQLSCPHMSNAPNPIDNILSVDTSILKSIDTVEITPVRYISSPENYQQRHKKIVKMLDSWLKGMQSKNNNFDNRIPYFLDTRGFLESAGMGKNRSLTEHHKKVKEIIRGFINQYA